MPDGSNFTSTIAPALSSVALNTTRRAGAATEKGVVVAEAGSATLARRERGRLRRLREKKEMEERREARRRELAQTPFRRAPLLSRDGRAHELTAKGLEDIWQSAIRSVWELGPKATPASQVRVARDSIASWQLLPVEINALARILMDFNREWDWGTYDAKCKWLEAGAGCCIRCGTIGEAHSAAWDVIEACTSILVELPIEYPEDGDVILQTLAYTNWRLPSRGRQRAAERMARLVTERIVNKFDFKLTV